MFADHAGGNGEEIMNRVKKAALKYEVGMGYKKTTARLEKKINQTTPYLKSAHRTRGILGRGSR